MCISELRFAFWRYFESHCNIRMKVNRGNNHKLPLWICSPSDRESLWGRQRILSLLKASFSRRWTIFWEQNTWSLIKRKIDRSADSCVKMNWSNWARLNSDLNLCGHLSWVGEYEIEKQISVGNFAFGSILRFKVGSAMQSSLKLTLALDKSNFY